MKDGAPAAALEGVQVRSFDQFSAILTIASLSSHHQGVYACTAANAAATDSHEEHLNVNGNS